MKALQSVTLISILASTVGCMEMGAVDEDGNQDSNDLYEIVARHGDNHNRLPNNVPVFDASGVFTTVSSHGFIDLDNEFFQDLGTNGRRCVTCHVPTAGWTLSPKQLQAVFDATDGGKFDDGLGLSAAFR